MAWEARLGLKPAGENSVSLLKHRLNGLGSPFGIVRHVTHHRIPGRARRNEEERSWVTQSTLSRKTRGKAAYWESRRNLTDDRDEDGETRAVWVKLHCLKFNRQRSKTGPTGKRLKPVPICARVFNPDPCNLLRTSGD